MLKKKEQISVGEDMQLLVFKHHNKIFSMYLRNLRPAKITVTNPDELNIRDVFIGRFIEKAGNIDAAFISMPDGTKGFLSLKENKKLYITSKGEWSEPKIGDDILVQIESLPAKGKKAKLTGKISIEGKYAVAMKGKGTISVSTKISEPCKKKLYDIAETNAKKYKEKSFIIRTNAENLTGETIDLLENDMRKTSDELDRVYQNASHKESGAIIRQAPRAYLAEIQSLLDRELAKVITNDEQLYEEILEFLQKENLPYLDKIKLYNDERVPMKVIYGIEQKLDEVLLRKVWLKSGGFLVIDPTEAMTVIDVNSGKYVKKTDSEDTYLNINLDAAKEVAYQIRIRNLSGIIIVDFINMKSQENYNILLSQLAQYLHEDWTHTKIEDVTKLGLVEITRKKTDKTLQEQIFG